MKILSADQIKEADAYTIAHEPIASINLMERAAKACVEQILRFGFVSRTSHFDVYCGPGNNGGDGLAIARLLSEKGIQVRVFSLASEKYSPDYLINRDRLLERKIPVQVLSSETEFPTILPEVNTIVIDALFGTGISRKLEGLSAAFVDHINKLHLPVIAIDMPSGLPCDIPCWSGAAVIRANHTLTFQQPKLALLMADNGPNTGMFHVLDIGLHGGFIASLPSRYYYITPDDARQLLNPRARFSHKGSYGHALLIAGSHGKTGACILAARACLRSGAGLLTLHAPACATIPLQTAVPEAMLVPDEEERILASPVHLDAYNAVGIGPGIGTDKQTGNVLKVMIQQSRGPMVLDADALNLLAENKTWIAFLPKNSILTPHPKEFERLTGMKGGSFDRLEWQKEFSVKHGVYVVLKGANTSISCPGGEVFFNSSGNPGMAKGGSGDVLTGLLTGLLAQGYLPQEAAVFGVYLHGLAGDIAAKHFSMEGMTAGDLVAALPEAFLEMHQNEFH